MVKNVKMYSNALFEALFKQIDFISFATPLYLNDKVMTLCIFLLE